MKAPSSTISSLVSARGFAAPEIYARDIDQLFMWTIYVSAAVFVLVNVLLAVAIISGRRRRKQDIVAA